MAVDPVLLFNTHQNSTATGSTIIFTVNFAWHSHYEDLCVCVSRGSSCKIFIKNYHHFVFFFVFTSYLIPHYISDTRALCIWHNKPVTIIHWQLAGRARARYQRKMEPSNNNKKNTVHIDIARHIIHTHTHTNSSSQECVAVCFAQVTWNEQTTAGEGR